VVQELSTQLDSIEDKTKQKHKKIKQQQQQQQQKNTKHTNNITDPQATPQKHRFFLNLHLLGVVGSRRASNSRSVWREKAPPKHRSIETHTTLCFSDGSAERKHKKEGCGLFKRNVKHTQTCRDTFCLVVELVLNDMSHDSSLVVWKCSADL
jgi:hypothetical protein